MDLTFYYEMFACCYSGTFVFLMVICFCFLFFFWFSGVEGWSYCCTCALCIWICYHITHCYS